VAAVASVALVVFLRRRCASVTAFLIGHLSHRSVRYRRVAYTAPEAPPARRRDSDGEHMGAVVELAAMGTGMAALTTDSDASLPVVDVVSQ
jgi:hypothetical protein